MKIDMHCHAIGKGNVLDNRCENVYFNINDDPCWWMRKYFEFLYAYLENRLIGMGADTSGDGEVGTKESFDLMFRLLHSANEIDGVVLLAFDAVYSKSGELNRVKTDLCVANSFLDGKVRELNAALKDKGFSNKQFFLGASVNPNRKDWVDELDFIIEQTDAVLIKWIPSVQHIRVSDVAPSFYRKLEKANLPLLSHVGREHTFPEGERNPDLDNFEHLAAPLREGVKVIAAHCNTPSLPLLEENRIREFRKFMEKHRKAGHLIWADTSALSTLNKTPYIPEIVDAFDPEWLVHGSDFPIPVNGWMQLPLLYPEIDRLEYERILKERNPLDIDVLIKRAHGFSDTILENTARVIRMKQQ